MILTRKLALALYLAFSFTTLSSNAQVDSTTGNLINYGTSATDTTSTWNNGVYVNQLCFGAGQPGNCGPNPSVRPGGYINFSYGTADLNQIVNINRALAAGGTGVQLSGFNFGFTAKNGNHWDDARQDYLAAYVRLKDSAGNQIANYDYTDQTNRKYNWTNFNFSETFASPYVASTLSTAQVGFVGRDNNFWAGNYGPEVFDVSFSLKYRVNPCATNPAYSSTCTGFNSIVTSNNVLPNPDAWGTSINQMVAINTALKNGGAGAMVHGFNYGFDYNVGQSWSGCTATNQDGSCSWYMNIPASVNATALLTNSSNQTIVSKNHNLTGDGTSGSVSGQYLLSSSLNQTALGNLRLYGSASGTGSSLGNFSASLIYTVDPCNANPLYNTSCSGYGAAMAKSLAPPTTTSSPTMAAMPSSPSGTSPMDNNGPGQGPSDGSFNVSGPGPASQQAAASSEPPGSAPPGSTPSAGPTSQQVTQSNSPSSTPSSPASSPAQRQESGSKSGGGGNLSLAMSVVSRVQAADRATQASAVANAQQVVATSSAAAQEQANQVVDQANALSAESSQASQTITASSTSSSSSQQTSSASAGGLQGPVVMSIQSLTANAIQSSSGTTQSVASTTSQVNESANTQTQNSQGLALQLPQPEPVVTTGTQQTSSNYTPSMTSELPVVQSPNSQGLPLQAPQAEPVTASVTQQAISTYTPPTASMTSELSVVQSSSSQGLPLQAPQVSEPVQSATQTQSTYQPPAMTSNESNSMYSLTAGVVIRPSQGINLNSQSSTTIVAMITPPMMQPKQEFKFETRTEQEQPQVFQPQQTAMTRGSILNDIIEQRVNVASFQMEQQMDTVKKNVLPNELAGGVDIAAMALVPKGYEVYSIVTLRDVPFYKPEAIYKDNKTVDNARVLRGLTSGSDAKHQEMVNQQYK
jgi:hypothetical protein